MLTGLLTLLSLSGAEGSGGKSRQAVSRTFPLACHWEAMVVRSA